MRYLGVVGLAMAALLALGGSASATTLTSPAGTTLGVGAEVKAEAEAPIGPDGTTVFSCKKSSLESKVTNAGGEGTTVKAEVSNWTLSECGNQTVEVKKPGTLEIHWITSGNGMLMSSGAEITLLTHGIFIGTRHCLYATSNTEIGVIRGSSTTGGTATLDIDAVAISQPATDGNCGNDTWWTGSYKFTSPDYLDVD